ncbi:COG4223 family protein [Chelativorans salis]|uniref:Phage tail protein n=1 Tax=Chelativorans salis TaxID=2978478 RepID=A0ABT2LSA7_9HYPH|nr:phage tail protein [Chelativorans sp. EGI FJ00035]MCT7377251.1 phage tail protein [Chelativorans sp. EGI FJ00035]
MAKTPRTRHSRTKREPVTIDLEADQVKRESEEAEDTTGPAPAEEGKAQEAAAAETSEAAEKEEAHASNEQENAASEAEGEGPTDEAGDAETADAGAQDEPVSEPAPAEPRSGGGGGRALAAGVAGGVIGLVLASALQWANVLPVPGAPGDAPDAAVEGLRQEVETMRGEISQLRETASAGPSDETVEQALAEPRQQIAELREMVSSLQESVSSGGAGETAGLDALDARLSDLESQLASLSETAGQAGANGASAERLEALESALAAQEAASANAQQLDTLSGEVQALSEQVASQDEGPRLALVVAASALRSAVERGEPFASELETYSALAPDTPELDPLRQYADTGIPTHAELAEEAPGVASRIAAVASAPPEGAGFFERLMASARSAITVRPVGEVEGETPQAIAARLEAAVIEGDYAQALAEYEALPPEAQEAANSFAERLRARQAADGVLEQALSDALKPA